MSVFQPIILIGAARSGTKLLRDVIATHPAVDRVPYDINYVWRLGNEHLNHDELPESALTHEICRRIVTTISGSFSTGKPYLVEKTVSNCLRVPFVQQIFPNARFLHLVRDGRDVIESSYRQWMASPDWRYILRKAIQFPILQAPSYALSYTRTMLHKLVVRDREKEHKTGTWGPRYEGIDDDVASKALIEVCAIQWARSVNTALAGLSQIPAEQVFTIRYEDFVEQPSKLLADIAQFIGLDPAPFESTVQQEDISRQNLGKGLRNLKPEQVALVIPQIDDTLKRLGYL